MTVDELTFLLERLAEAGCTADQLLAAARAARDWRTERRLFLAVKRALAETGSPAEQVSSRSATGDKSAASTGDKNVPGTARLGAKHSARKAVLHAPGFRPQTRAVLAALIDRAEASTGNVRVSLRQLAADAGIAGRDNGRAVQRALRVCEAWAFLVPAGPKKCGSVRTWRVAFDALEALRLEIEGPEDSRRQPAAIRGGERRLELERASRRAGPARTEQPGTNPRTGDTPVPLTHRDIQIPSSRKERSVAREPKRQLELPGTMGVVAGTQSRRQVALARSEQAILAKHPRHRAEIHRRLVLLDAVDRHIIADAELERAGDGCSALERLIGFGRAPSRAAGGGG